MLHIYIYITTFLIQRYKEYTEIRISVERDPLLPQ